MEEEKNPIQVADRLFQTLETLAANGPTGLMELSSELDLHKSTVHRILNSLIYMGYARQDAETNKYSLTYKILEISHQLLNKADIIDTLRPHLKKLVNETGETVHLVSLDEKDAVYIDKVESFQNSVRMVSKVGSRIPLYCSGVGKAMMAEMSPERVEKIWQNSEIRKMTEHTITEFPQFLKVLEEVKKNGYAMDNEENEIGVRCIAACLKDYSGKPQYAFSISVPVNRLPDERVGELARAVMKAKEEMMKEII